MDDESAADDSSADPPEMSSALAELKVPGLAIGIVEGGTVRCTSVGGLMNVEAERPVEDGTVFLWASVSKTVVATAAMILVEDGQLDLDADVNRYLPFGVDNPHCSGAPITARQLLTHSASIIDDERTYDASYTKGDAEVSLEDFARDYFVPGGAHYDADRNFDVDCPGTYVEYSNIGFGLMGLVIERAAGVPFDEFCRTRIFEPLGMNHTSYRLAALDLESVATLYEGNTTRGLERVPHQGFATYPDGLLRSPIGELSRFLAMTSAGGTLDGVEILSPGSVEEMLRIQDPALDEVQGLGFYYDFRGRFAGHDGEDDGASSIMFFDPASGRGVAMVANGIWYHRNGDDARARALLKSLLGTGECPSL